MVAGISRSADPSPVALVWFRRDLRCSDHPALLSAAASGQRILPVFILSPGLDATGGASRWWLHHSLRALQSALAAHGGRLVLASGDPAAVLDRLTSLTGTDLICFNRSCHPSERAEEERAVAALGARLRIHRAEGDWLHEPGRILSASGTPLRVFTPFWRACQRAPSPILPTGIPRNAAYCHDDIPSEVLDDWNLTPQTPDWSAGLRHQWQPGEHGARCALDRFLDTGIAGYATHRDRPDLAGTSRLSPHLHFGEISPRQVWHAVEERLAGAAALTRGTEAFQRELGWREFALHLLWQHPDLAERPLQPKFARFPWRDDPGALRCWHRGSTGYPLVDAGMRELWATGWMHNRVRMITASFLVKHLLIDWRCGAAWFADTLVDADLANNNASWQWVAGCGTDAAPWFRIFNPVLQGRRFDPEGRYVRRWIPEIAGLPDRYLHAPWTAPQPELRAAGILPGKTYPLPIIDHAAGRARALGALRAETGNPD